MQRVSAWHRIKTCILVWQLDTTRICLSPQVLKQSHRKSHKTGNDGAEESLKGEERKIARNPVSKSLTLSGRLASLAAFSWVTRCKLRCVCVTRCKLSWCVTVLQILYIDICQQHMTSNRNKSLQTMQMCRSISMYCNCMARPTSRACPSKARPSGMQTYTTHYYPMSWAMKHCRVLRPPLASSHDKGLALPAVSIPSGSFSIGHNGEVQQPQRCTK